MMLKCSYKSITIPKFGNSVDENEDNFSAPTNSEVESAVALKFAIADGATESSFSKEWADLLVSFYKDSRFNGEHITQTIKRASESWVSLTSRADLPWFAQQKAEIGAFATLLGLTVNKKEGTFDAVAVGDSSLFHVQSNNIVLTFPLKSAEQFGNTPHLIASNPRHQTEFDQIVVYSHGYIEPTDMILLATDALAAWVFKQWNAGEKPWDHLQNILTHYTDDFEKWLNNQRRSNEIKNDDVTLIIITFE